MCYHPSSKQRHPDSPCASHKDLDVSRRRVRLGRETQKLLPHRRGPSICQQVEQQGVGGRALSHWLRGRRIFCRRPQLRLCKSVHDRSSEAARFPHTTPPPGPAAAPGPGSILYNRLTAGPPAELPNSVIDLKRGGERTN